MKSLRCCWLLLLLLLAGGPVAASPVDWKEIHAETVAQAEAGDTDAMLRLVEGRAQVRFGAFGKRSYVPVQSTGMLPRDEYRYSWSPSPAEHLQWIRRAADAGVDRMQRVMVLCHQFGCLHCRSGFNNQRTCTAEHGVARDTERARTLARDYRAASANPAHWDSLQGLLDEWATLEPRAQRNDGAAAGRLAVLAGQALARAVPVPAPHVSLYLPSGGSLVLQNTTLQEHWQQVAARLGDPATLEKTDPAARQAAQARRVRERVQAALKQEAQERRQLLGASQAK